MNKGLVSLAAFFLALAPVKANGIATINVEGNNETTVGETISVKLNLQDIKDTVNGVVAIGGDLKFDDEYLEYVGSTDLNTNYKTDINEKIYRIAGLDYTLNNGIKDDTSIYSFNFKVLKEGNTVVTFENAEVVDVDASEVKTNVKSLNIKINNKIEEVKTPEIETLDNNENVIVEAVKEEKIEEKVNKIDVKESVIATNDVENVVEENYIDSTEEVNSDTNKSFIEKVADLFVGFFNILVKIFKFKHSTLLKYST